MKLDLLNESTALDKKGIVWFRTVLNKPHAFWITCSECGKRSNNYWESYPNNDILVCNNCKEDF